MSTLPLSWINSTKNTFVNYIKLGFSTFWIYSCSISNISTIANILKNLSKKPNANFVIRGCNKKISKYLYQNNFDSIIIGKEAIIELGQDPFIKKSLKELVKRGLKNGIIKEIDNSTKSVKKLEEIKSNSAHSNEPQLKYLFLDEFIPETRVFAFINKMNIWQGAILISLNSPQKVQTELLLRRISAPNGMMEALINYIYNILKKEGFKEWSLGEVPFIVDPNDLMFLSKPYILNKIGKALKYAYNYEGLYYFKNKFATRWENIYLCARPTVKFRHIFMLSAKSRLLSLTLYKLLR